MKLTITYILANVLGENIHQLVKITHQGDQSVLVPTIKDACRQFALTNKGAEYVDEVEGDFNWGDFCQNIDAVTPFFPEWIKCVDIVEADNLVVVDHDQQLMLTNTKQELDALLAAQQCMGDLVEVYERNPSNIVLDEAVRSLKFDALPKVRRALKGNAPK